MKKVQNKVYQGDLCHERLLARNKPLLAYNEGAEYGAWQSSVRAKLAQLMGDMPSVPAVNIAQEYRTQREGYEEIRVGLETEDGFWVPMHILIPHSVPKPCPVVICLQGHSTGMHISLGVSKVAGDENDFPRAAHALNAVKNGFAALVLEQRGMGELKSARTGNDTFTAYTALLMGRTIIGERVWDVSRGIDMLECFPEIDANKVIVLGNSGGGTTAYYAAAMDDRIKLAVPSCSVSSYADSIGNVFHCPCNYIPGIAQWMDMGEIAALIAPRKLLVATGELDEIFPIAGVKRVYGTIERIYKQAGAPDGCKLIITSRGHWFCDDLIWPEINRIAAQGL